MSAPRQLKVKLLHANFLKDADLITRMDPYAVVEMNGATQRSNVARRQGKTPEWNQLLVFNYSGEQSFFIKFYDKDLIKDDFLGETVVVLTGMPLSQTHRGTFPIVRRGLDNGTVTLEVHIEGMPLVTPPAFYQPLQHQTSPQIAYQTFFPAQQSVVTTTYPQVTTQTVVYRTVGSQPSQPWINSTPEPYRF